MLACLSVLNVSVSLSTQIAKTIMFSAAPHRWKGGWGMKLEGSDHAPVYTNLEEIHEIPKHSTPSLSARYLPMIHGVQQTLGMAEFHVYLKINSASVVVLSFFYLVQHPC